jgi:hypothetical protein
MIIEASLAKIISQTFIAKVPPYGFPMPVAQSLLDRRRVLKIQFFVDLGIMKAKLIRIVILFLQHLNVKFVFCFRIINKKAKFDHHRQSYR